MKMKHQEYGNVSVVELCGEFVEEYCKPFEEELTGLVKNSSAGIVLDMSKTVFIDSRGLEELLWLKDYCHQNKGQLKLAGLDENIKKILEITRIAEQLDRYEELAEAVKSFT